MSPPAIVSKEIPDIEVRLFIKEFAIVSNSCQTIKQYNFRVVYVMNCSTSVKIIAVKCERFK